MTYPTEAALAALAANGHKVTTDIDGEVHELAYCEHVGRCCWVPVAEAVSGGRWGHRRCYEPDAVIAMEMLHCIQLTNSRVVLRDDGWVETQTEGAFPDLLAAYRAVCTPATPGEVAVEPKPKGGVAAIMGRWPGDETDEQVERAMDEQNGGAMPTNEEQYEAMVARGHGDLLAVRLANAVDGKRFVHKKTVVSCPDPIVSACLLAGQLEALREKHGEAVGITYLGRQAIFQKYLAAFPLAAPPEPSAAEELARSVKIHVDLIERGGSKLEAMDGICAAYARYVAATAGGR